VALYPPLVWHSVHLMTEPLFISLTLATLYALLRARRKSPVFWAVAAGLAVGLAALSRSVILGFVPLAGVWLWWMQGRRRLAVAAALVFWVAAAVPMAPWWSRNYRLFGRFVPSTTDAGHGFYVANNKFSLADPRGFWIPGDPDPRPGHDEQPEPRSFAFLKRPGETRLGDEVEISRRLVREALSFWVENPGAWFLLMARRFWTFWRPWPHVRYVPMAYVVVYGLSYIPSLLLMIPGFGAAWLRKKGDRGGHALVLLLVVFMTAVHTLVLAMSRYRVPMMPVLLMYSGYALVAVWDRVQGDRRKPVSAELRRFDRISEEYDISLPAHVQDHYLRRRQRVLAPLLGGGKGLDVGCGTGKLMERLSEDGRVFGVDGSNGMLIVLKDAGRGAAAKAVTRALPFDNDAFDVVWCVAVLHHLGSPEMVASTIREMARVTRPGGHVVVWDHNPNNPYWPIVMSRVPQDTGDERLVSAAEIDAALEEAGITERTLQRRGFVPDFSPRWLLWLFQVMEFVVERAPLLNRIAAHNVMVGRKPS